MLIWVQMVLGAAIGGILVYLIARKNRLLAGIIGLLLVVDLVWGAYSRAILTDGLFADMLLLGFAILLWHYQRKFKVSKWEYILVGLVYGLIVCIRPSNIFLAVLIPPCYFVLTRSLKKALFITLGISIFFIIVGLINLKGTQKFYILAPSGGHGSDFIAFPLFVNKLFSPENGPVSTTIDQYLQACYPGLNYAQAIDDRSAGMAIDTVKNMKFIMGQVLPCIEFQRAAHHEKRNLFPTAYFEALATHPVQFAQMVAREAAVFLRYGNAYVINWQLNTSSNYGCTNLSWCDQITNSRFEWSSSTPAVQMYEKVSVKILQVYLAPMGFLNLIFHDNQTVPVLFSWLVITALMIFFTRGYERLLFTSATVVILFTAVLVVVGYGFTERYPSMLSPIQAVYSALTWYAIGRLVIWGWNKASVILSAQTSKQRA